MTPLATSIGSTITNVVDAAGNFFSQLSALNFWSLLLGLALYAIYLLLRSRALFNAVRAAYPGVEVRWRDVWGAYMVGYAINNVFPLGGGNVAQLFRGRGFNGTGGHGGLLLYQVPMNSCSSDLSRAASAESSRPMRPR